MNKKHAGVPLLRSNVKNKKGSSEKLLPAAC
jgi:hypothetical protein